MPVTTNEMLLRGCMLKNSNYVLGLVVYTGKESRIQMNAAKTPNKVGETLHTFAHGQSWLTLVILAKRSLKLVVPVTWYVTLILPHSAHDLRVT